MNVLEKPPPPVEELPFAPAPAPPPLLNDAELVPPLKSALDAPVRPVLELPVPPVAVTPSAELLPPAEELPVAGPTDPVPTVIVYVCAATVAFPVLATPAAPPLP